MKMMKMLIMIMMTMRMIINKSVIKNKECPSCGAIHFAQEDSLVCWNCCKKIPTDTQKMRYY